MKSLEIRPGNRSVVHHVLIYYRAKPDGKTPPIARANQRTNRIRRRTSLACRLIHGATWRGCRRGSIATYAPGTNPQVAPAGTAFRLEPGGILELQMHYTATGQPATDRTKVGITFATEPAPPREVRAQHFMNMTLKLPARAADVAVTTDLEFLQDATVWGLFPHTHLRGKRWAYTLELPDGEKKSILSVPRYDFNWQTYYMFTEPLQVPKGSKIVSTAWYDNSAANKSNPNPNVDVFWGDQTWQEMQYTGVLLSPGF